MKEAFEIFNVNPTFVGRVLLGPERSGMGPTSHALLSPYQLRLYLTN